MTGLTSRRGLHALALAAAVGVIASAPAVMNAAASNPSCDLPKSAQGNGYRGHPGSKSTVFDRAKRKRRRKLAHKSKRRNRR